jgi:hypothetical protein
MIASIFFIRPPGDDRRRNSTALIAGTRARPDGPLSIAGAPSEAPQNEAPDGYGLITRLPASRLVRREGMEDEKSPATAT